MRIPQMTSPQFANRQNPKVYTQTGQQVYLSRACSVVAEVCLYEVTQAKWYILLVKRGEACPDFQGDWCLPCGYLDWDETLYQAMIREVYEETGLYLSELHRHPKCQTTYPCNFAMNATVPPWLIYDTPTGNRQNLAFHYASWIAWTGNPLPTLTRLHSEESADLQWVEINIACEMILAFGHQHRIRALQHDQAASFRQVEHMMQG